MAHGGAPAPGSLYGGVDGPLFHGGSLLPTLSAASPSLDSTGAAPSAAAQDPPPPKFYKLEFPMPGSDEPLPDPFAGKMLTRQVSAAVRLQASTCGLLARRRVREMRDLQLIQPYTPS